MSEFNITSWMKKQYLAEAKLDTPKSSQLASAINSAIEGIDSEMNYRDFAVAVASILENGYGSHLYDKFMEVLHAELGINEEISDYEMVVYKVEGITANPDEGGPDEPFEMEVKLDASLSAEEVKTAIRDAARREQGRLYKLDYTKA